MSRREPRGMPRSMPIDLTTRAGALRFAEQARDEMARVFRRDGRWSSRGASMAVVIFKTHGIDRAGAETPAGWATGERFARAQAELMSPPPFAGLVGAELTTAVGAAARHYARLTRAVGALVMQEMWFAESSDPDRDIERPHGWVTSSGDRREQLHMRLEHMTMGVVQWRAEIRRHPTRLDPWLQTMTIPPEFAHVDEAVRLGNIIDWRS